MMLLASADRLYKFSIFKYFVMLSLLIKKPMKFHLNLLSNKTPSIKKILIMLTTRIGLATSLNDSNQIKFQGN